LAVDAVVGLALLGPLEAKGLALGNALGILTMGVILVVGIHRTVEPLDLFALLRGTIELVAVAAAAGVIAWAAAAQLPASIGSLVHLSVGGALVIVLYPLIGRAFRVREMEPVFDLVRRHRARRNDDRSASKVGLGVDV
jgi:peptidoglycan biosynthesis protein MviN/MurJ (putative lipid II flippase)